MHETDPFFTKEWQTMLEQRLSNAQTTDRRAKARISCSYPAVVQGWDTSGRKFRTNATLTNLSASGVCLVLSAEIQTARRLFVLFRCSSTGPLGKTMAPLIAMETKLVRTEPSSSGMQVVALKIQRNRFL
jgi:hypothetical protein